MQKNKGVWLEDIKEKQLVVFKSNKLIEASYKLNLQEARIILLLASMIKRDDKDFNLVRIRVKDFVDFVGVKGKDIYKRVQKITDSLGDKSLIIKGENPKTGERTRLKMQWLASSEYFHGNGYVELEFSQKLKPLLLQLRTRFTSYQLEYALKLRKSYSIRIYEIVRQWRVAKTRTFKIEELRELLGLDKGIYQQYNHFKERILKPAQKEISEKTDVSFDFTEIKKRRKVVKIRFDIKLKKIDKSEQLTPPKVEKIKNVDLYQKLVDYFCVNPKEAVKVLNKYPESQILQNLAYVEYYYNKQGHIKNLGPYTLKAIRENYRQQLSLFEKDKEQAQKQKDREQQQEQELQKLKTDYKAYKHDKREELKKTLKKGELEQIEDQCRQELKKQGKHRYGIKTTLRFEVEKCLDEKAGVLSFDDWVKNRQQN